jgi:hypothetical protein
MPSQKTPRLAALALATALALASGSAMATLYTFSGSSNGGSASATIDTLISGNVLTATISNTTFNSGLPAYNDAIITGFGFDFVGSPTITSWTLTAYRDPDDASPVTIGASSGPVQSPSWVLGASLAGVTLDFVPQTDNGANGGLLNPGYSSSPVNNRWFTNAVFTATFSSAPQIVATAPDADGICSGTDPCNPYVRFQEVGNGGSLKLTALPPSDGGTVPVPGSVALLGIGLLGLVRASRSAAR